MLSLFIQQQKQALIGHQETSEEVESINDLKEINTRILGILSTISLAFQLLNALEVEYGIESRLLNWSFLIESNFKAENGHDETQRNQCLLSCFDVLLHFLIEDKPSLFDSSFFSCQNSSLLCDCCSFFIEKIINFFNSFFRVKVDDTSFRFSFFALGTRA